MILVDSRIGSGDLLDPIAKRVNGKAKVTTLNSADVAFVGNGPTGDCNVGIERKTLGDMLNCMRNGRYAGDQLIKMAEDYDFSYLIVEGIFRPSEQGVIETLTRGGWGTLRFGKQHYQYSELDKFLDSLELHKNVMVKRSASKMETVWMIVNLYTYFQKDWESHHSTDAIKIQNPNIYSKPSLVRLVAAQLPGIGWGRSKDLEKAFPTVERLANALPSELEQIDGIGKKTALKVYGSIRGRE